MTEIVNEIRKGFYLDSVALMRLSAEISSLGGIEEAVLMIGTPSNLQIMQDAGVLNATGESASPNDLVIALRADGKSNANRALAHANKSLEGGALKSADSGTAKSRTLRGGLEAHPDANLALISTPGSYAAREAHTALELGLNVMIFSDNVSIEQEAALKATAQKNKLLVMGPDCGTAYIDNVPLAFANALVSHPDIDGEHDTTITTGVIAASGTGLQEFAVLLNKLGGRLKHGIGVGGRDLSDAIGGISTLTAIELLANDNDIDQIVLISKPPGPDTARLVFDKLANCGKPVITCVFGLDDNHPNKTGNSSTLREAAEQATGKSLPEKTDIKSQGKSMAATLSGKQSTLIGLYTGGTLCTESQLILQAAGLEITSNATAPGSPQSVSQLEASHRIIDLGADEYTVGRPHPMMEPLVRVEPLQQALNDPSIAVVLLDVVLGYGAHENPAKAVAEAVQNATKTNAHRPVVIASVCGTVADPQGLHQQHNLLSDSGITVCNSNTEAAELAAEIINQIN